MMDGNGWKVKMEGSYRIQWGKAVAEGIDGRLRWKAIVEGNGGR